MKYVMEIRDLTNEGKQLNEICEVSKVNCEIMTKEINILAESHYQAICSYFEHLFHEVDKLGVNSFRVASYGDGIILCYNKNREHCLYIKQCVNSYRYEWMDTSWRQSICINKHLYQDQSVFSTLLGYWSLFKEAVNESINKKIKEVEEANSKKNADLSHTLNFYQNFKI